jgi:hypothetical protein
MIALGTTGSKIREGGIEKEEEEELILGSDRWYKRTKYLTLEGSCICIRAGFLKKTLRKNKEAWFSENSGKMPIHVNHMTIISRGGKTYTSTEVEPYYVEDGGPIGVFGIYSIIT